jgi:hypothetical protein
MHPNYLDARWNPSPQWLIRYRRSVVFTLRWEGVHRHGCRIDDFTTFLVSKEGTKNERATSYSRDIVLSILYSLPVSFGCPRLHLNTHSRARATLTTSPPSFHQQLNAAKANSQMALRPSNF